MPISDSEIIAGLKSGYKSRIQQEKRLYTEYSYFIKEAGKKYNLVEDDCFSAYSDAVLAVLQNIAMDRFDGRSSLKTYLYQIFSNKCIDLVRKNATNKQQVHQTMAIPELLGQLPDAARSVVERLISDQVFLDLKSQLNKIGQKCKDILMLFEDGLTDREIAVELSYNNAAVAKTTRLRCLDKLREKMAPVIQLDQKKDNR